MLVLKVPLESMEILLFISFLALNPFVLPGYIIQCSSTQMYIHHTPYHSLSPFHAPNKIGNSLLKLPLISQRSVFYYDMATMRRPLKFSCSSRQLHTAFLQVLCNDQFPIILFVSSHRLVFPWQFHKGNTPDVTHYSTKDSREYAGSR